MHTDAVRGVSAGGCADMPLTASSYIANDGKNVGIQL